MCEILISFIENWLFDTINYKGYLIKYEILYHGKITGLVMMIDDDDDDWMRPNDENPGQYKQYSLNDSPATKQIRTCMQLYFILQNVWIYLKFTIYNLK